MRKASTCKSRAVTQVIYKLFEETHEKFTKLNNVMVFFSGRVKLNSPVDEFLLYLIVLVVLKIF